MVCHEIRNLGARRWRYDGRGSGGSKFRERDSDFCEPRDLFGEVTHSDGGRPGGTGNGDAGSPWDAIIRGAAVDVELAAEAEARNSVNSSGICCEASVPATPARPPGAGATDPTTGGSPRTNEGLANDRGPSRTSGGISH